MRKVFLFLTLLFSCTVFSLYARNLSTVNDGYEMIRLENKSDESKIYGIERVFLTNDRIIVYDKYRLMIYTKDGKFVKSDIEMRGTKRNQYNEGYINEVAFDETEKELYVYTGNPSKIIVLDLDLNFKRTLDLDLGTNEKCIEMCISGNHIYALLCHKPQVESYRLISFDKREFNNNSLNAKATTVLTFDKIMKPNFQLGRQMTVCDDVYLTIPYCSKVYALKDGGIYKQWDVQLADWFNYDECKSMQDNEFIEKLRNQTVMMCSPIANQDIIIARTNNDVVRFDKKNDAPKAQTHYKFPGIPLTLVTPTPSQGRYGYAVLQIHPNTTGFINSYAEDNKNEVDDRILSTIKEVNKEDNPIILIHKVE